MSKTTKKVLIIAGVVLDLAITTFLFVISIIMIVKLNKNNLDGQTHIVKDALDENSLISYFMLNPDKYLIFCVIPLFVLLAANIIILALYVKKTSASNLKVSDLSEEQKKALKKQLMEEINKEK